ncbi:hypothetical protein GDN83_09775 [Gordonia jinghuaiqii]|uniref:Uncharacterized protein n=1 Tax=Gordonia jinghuaiqii TaxID=2758710 RepID=A0A7D7LTA6_9ACTN|nr:hypothetical protein [Gordonia jinghuaiqii]MCR5978015.1 hypothetical protein [Gordonia jinghuaiqii]QMT01517.1 hypothetical protein H1R19_22350 [Gordonia jinghuaiqii]
MLNAVMLTLVLATGAAASVCAVTAAVVYLRPGRERLAAERLARRWLVATAVLGVSAICSRFVWLLVL